IGKIVGMMAFALATSVFMAMMMQGLTSLMQAADGGMANSGDQAVSVMLHVVMMIGVDVFTMLALPTIVGFGSGVTAGLAAPAGFAVGRALAGVNVGAAALAKAARSMSGGGSRSRPNSMS
ncbi:MAG: hypothetical protein ACRYGG_12480, partial [Janthinobacterium lividum]